MESRPLVGVTTSEVRRAERTQPLPGGRAAPARDGARDAVRARARARGRRPDRAAAAARRRRAVAAGAAARRCACPAARTSTRAPTAPSPSPDLGPVEPALDVFELEVARVADAAGLPIFGICRGAQALNVARGGTLHQHLPAVTDHSIDHRQTAPGWEETHAGARRSRLAAGAILGTDAAWVNSFHHQAVDRLGAGLRAVAWAPDGTVEGIEDAGERLVLGVQWHAETLDRGGPHPRLFEALVAAASGDAPRPGCVAVCGFGVELRRARRRTATRSSAWAPSLAPRGPGRVRLWVDGGVGHGPPAAGDHRPRPSAGAQPMRDGELTIVFNGCIYNHHELRARAARARATSSRPLSDTEVLLKGWARVGRGPARRTCTGCSRSCCATAPRTVLVPRPAGDQAALPGRGRRRRCAPPRRCRRCWRPAASTRASTRSRCTTT